LRDEKRRNIPVFELTFQFFARQRFDVGQHIRNLG
jgi:hypothetical protein